MSAEADIRDLIEHLHWIHKTEPFKGREIQLIQVILDVEFSWKKEFEEDSQWWGENVVEFVKEFLPEHFEE